MPSKNNTELDLDIVGYIQYICSLAECRVVVKLLVGGNIGCECTYDFLTMQTIFLKSSSPVAIEWVAPSQPQRQPKNMQSDGRPNDATANAVSFGFIAAAILISIFLVIAIFERLLRPRPPLTAASFQNTHSELSGMAGSSSRIEKSDEPSEVDYTKGVSVLMPGQVIPTYIARPVPYADSPEASSQNFQKCEIPSDSYIDVKADNSETQSAH